MERRTTAELEVLLEERLELLRSGRLTSAAAPDPHSGGLLLRAGPRRTFRTRAPPPPSAPDATLSARASRGPVPHPPGHGASPFARVPAQGAGGSCGRSSSSHVVTVMPPPSGGSTTSPLTVRRWRRGPDPPADPAPRHQGDGRPDRRHQQEQPRDRGEQARHEEQRSGAQPQPGVAHVPRRDGAGPAQRQRRNAPSPSRRSSQRPATLDASTSSTVGPAPIQCATRIATAISTIGSSRSPRPILLPSPPRAPARVDVTGRPRRTPSATPPARPVPPASAGVRRLRGSAAAGGAAPAQAPRPRQPSSSRPSQRRSASSGSAPTRVATREARAQRQPGLSTSLGEVPRRARPRGRPACTSALTPTVEMCTTARPASTARSRDIASCWTLSSV